MRIPFFRIFYSTSFTLLSLLLAALLLITPTDQITQAFRNRQIYNIFIIAGVHLLTLIAAVFIYASRLFANRSVLASIPRSWSPLRKGDVEKKVRRLVAEGLKRSAVIAYEAQPRDLSKEKASEGSIDEVQNINHPEPIWGIISHPGWTSPSSPDLRDLHFEPVILELANLIEAKAVSLAPADPLSTLGPTLEPSEAALPDALVVEILQRPSTMGLRDYIFHLTSLGVIYPPDIGKDFLPLYEKARFSDRPLDEPEFRSLMGVFASMLENMSTLDADIVAELHAEQEAMSNVTSSIGAERDSLETSATVEHTPRPHLSYSDESPPLSFKSGRSSQSEKYRGTPQPQAERGASTSRTASRRRGLQTPSLPSLRSAKSRASSTYSHNSAGSVIRLAEARGPLDLPYTILGASGQSL